MSTTAQATETGIAVWKADAVHTNIDFAVRHLMMSKVRGRFSDVQASVSVEDDDPTTAQIEATIGIRSIDTHEPKRDEHLRSADFFDAEHFPTMRFRSRRIEVTSEGEYRITGDLTIKDVTRPVVLDATLEGRATDPWGNERAGFSATGKLDRSEFGLTYNQALETGGVLIGDEVKMSIDVELVRQE